jgi:hypothetical protein
VVKRILTAGDVEAAASNGDKSIAVADGVLVTPLARDRAVALGVIIADGTRLAHGPRTGAGVAARREAPARSPRATAAKDLDVARLVLESRIRTVARRALLRNERDLSGLEDVVRAVLARLSQESSQGCACASCGRGGEIPS